MKDVFLNIFGRAKEKTILIVGDTMIDHYLHGDVTRQSPEAPVPVLLAQRDEYRLGGAANVANNLAKIGVKPLLISIIGKDSNGEKLVQMLDAEGIPTSGLIVTPTRPTTEKLRVIDKSNKQLIRLDFEKTDEIEDRLEDELISRFDKFIKEADGVLISDYAKGVMSPKFIKYVIEQSAAINVPVFVDPKPRHKDFYKNSYLVTPNEKEASEMAGVDSITDENCNEVGKRLAEMLSANVVMTRGSKGMRIFHKSGQIFDVPAKAQEVFDVTGAGDTVISFIALCCVSGLGITESCQLANVAARIVIEKFGTETAKTDEILKILSQEFND
ncbi:MAG: D-glycero-beta-D-manno-heptose-7-phosphate kinase [Candidatus Gracilibacteria bacterium]|jgi:D-beta-D-heptose 7-phosphate kinase/D-beta-D-heptose 1-phosphate adenosyltransferase